MTASPLAPSIQPDLAPERTHRTRSIPDAVIVLAVFLLALVAAALVLHKQFVHPGATGLCDGEDYPANVWRLCWVTHCLSSAPQHLFDSNSFFPAHLTLALEDYGLPLQAIFAPFYLITGEPHLSYTLFAVTGIALTATSAFFVSWRWLGSKSAACITAALFALSPELFWPELDWPLQHPCEFTLFLWPVTLLNLQNSLTTKDTKPLIWLGVLVALQGLCSSQMLLLSLLLLVPFALVTLVQSGDRGSIVKRSLPACAAVTVGVLCVLPAYWPMLQLKQAGVVASRTSPAVLMALSADLLPLAWPTALSVLLLIFIKAAALPERFQKQCTGYLTNWLVGMILSMGPMLKIGGTITFIPLPFALFISLPFLNIFRSPNRFLLLAHLWSALLAGLAFVAVAEWCRRRQIRAWSLVVPAVALVAIGWAGINCSRMSHPIPVISKNTLPRAYRWLKETDPASVILELPEKDTPTYLASSVFHWHRLVNGHASFCPPSYYPFTAQILAELPDPQGLQDAADLGVDYVFIHHQAIDAPGMRDAYRQLLKNVGGSDFGDIWVLPLKRFTQPSAKAEKVNLSVDGTPALLCGQWCNLTLSALTRGGVWHHPNPNFPYTVQISWSNQATAVPEQIGVGKLSLPPMVTQRTPAVCRLELSVPEKPGVYTLVVKGKTIEDCKLTLHVVPGSEGGTTQAQINNLITPRRARIGIPAPVFFTVANCGSCSFLEKTRLTVNWARLTDFGKLTGGKFGSYFNSIFTRRSELVARALWSDEKSTTIDKPTECQIPALFPGQSIQLPISVLPPDRIGTYRLNVSIAYPENRITTEKGATVSSMRELTSMKGSSVSVVAP